MTGFRPERPETVFTYGAPGLKFGVGARHELAFDLGQLGARRVLVVTDPGVAATGAPAEVADSLALGRCRGGRLRPRPGRAHRRQHDRGHRVRPLGRPVRRDRGDRRRQQHRHREGGEPAGHQRGRPHGLRQRPGRTGPGTHQPAAPAGRPPHHHRHRQREHHDLRARRPGPARQDRHLAPSAASDPRRRRPRAHDHPAGRRHGGGRARHPVPRAGELHRTPVRVVRAQERRRARARTAGRTRSPTCGPSRRSC